MQPDDEMFLLMPAELPPSEVGQVFYFELPTGEEINCVVTRVHEHPVVHCMGPWGAPRTRAVPSVCAAAALVAQAISDQKPSLDRSTKSIRRERCI